MGLLSLPPLPPSLLFPPRRLPAQQVREATLTCGSALLPHGAARACGAPERRGRRAAAGGEGGRAAVRGGAERSGGRCRPAPRLAPMGGAEPRPAPEAGQNPLTCPAPVRDCREEGRCPLQRDPAVGRRGRGAERLSAGEPAS